MLFLFLTSTKKSGFSYWPQIIHLLLLACVSICLAFILYPTAVRAHATPFPDGAESSLALEGLDTDDTLCQGAYRIAGTELCTHGPDATPPDLELHPTISPVSAGATSASVLCEGDGISGPRVQLLYVRAENVTNRYEEYLARFHGWAADVALLYNRSAQLTGDQRHVRFVTDSDCQPSVIPVVIPAEADASLSATIVAVREQGHNRDDRKYLMFVDAATYCGIATAINDSSPGPENRNNTMAGYGRVDSPCWGGTIAAHELTHMLGGVQHDAPNASGGWHCVDEYDLMCYSDAPLRPALQYLCPLSHDGLLDCNNDDYFHTNPPSDSYLATHWNVANSVFLTIGDEFSNMPPFISLSTLTSTLVFTAPATITFTAQASDSDGTIMEVAFSQGSTLLSSRETSPYSFTWANIASGVYTITATAHDDLGANTTSDPIVILIVDPLPSPPTYRGDEENEEEQERDEEEHSEMANLIYLPLMVNEYVAYKP